MTMYATSDADSITIPGGCGASHARDNADRRLAVTCAACEPLIPASWGWANHVEHVALTPDERRQLETDERSAQKAGVDQLLKLRAGGGRDDVIAELAAQIADLTARLNAAETPKATPAARKTTPAKAA